MLLPDSSRFSFQPQAQITLSIAQLTNLQSPLPDEGKSSKRRLRVFMPADGPNINLCKTIMSAVALGYPLPTLLNWDGAFNRPDWHFQGSHIAKLESLLAVIEELLDGSGDASEDDLALMVDAYDIWFQLPPSVLIQRFHQLNREADERNQQKWEQMKSQHPNFPIEPPRQSIIVTGAKDCFPDPSSGSDGHYDLWPASPMPEDLYGDDTDKFQTAIVESSRRFRRIRPRCANSGMIMGTMGAMRDALTRCREKVEEAARAGRQLWSDQALFAEVIGDQEAWRLWTQELASTWNGTGAVTQNSIRHSHVRDVASSSLRGQRFEFGIGIDYNFTTIPPTCSSEEDAYFAQIDNMVQVKVLSREAGVPGDIRLKHTPPELDAALDLREGPYSAIRWGQQPLYSDFFFGTTPVGIHHNAYAHGLKAFRLKTWWPLMWFHPMLRELVTYSLNRRSEGEKDILSMVDPSGNKVNYTNPQENSVTVFTSGNRGTVSSFEPKEWDQVCQKGTVPWYDELFGDERGPLLL